MIKSLYIKVFFLAGFFFFQLTWGLANTELSPPFIKNGEKLKFKITYLGITGGYADFQVKLLPKNRVKFEVRAYTEDWTKNLYTLNLSHISYVEKNNLQILKHIEIKNENNRYYNGVQIFPLNQKFYYFTDRNREKIFKSIKVDHSFSGGLSIIGAFYYMRTYKNLEVGKKYELNAFIRENARKVYVNILRKENKKTSFGKRNVIVISPQTDFKGFIDDQRGMEIFISDDKYRLPLVVESQLLFGKIKAFLIEPMVYPNY